MQTQTNPSKSHKILTETTLDGFGLVFHRKDPDLAFAVACNTSHCQMDLEEAASKNRNYWSDTITNKTLCEKCGYSLQYCREQFSLIGEDVPKTLEEAHIRLKTL